MNSLILPQPLSSSLNAKAELMNNYQQKRAVAANLKRLHDTPASLAKATQIRAAQFDLMNAWNIEADDGLLDQLTITDALVGQQILALKAAPLADKPIMLSSMFVIDVHHAALFLGITNFSINHFNAFHGNIFGKQYMNERHYSLDELMLIDSNPEWLTDYRAPSCLTAPATPSNCQFSPYTVVEEKVAIAYCNISRVELPKVAYVTSDNIQTYCLIDLEKIRVAKLKAQQG